MVPRVLLGLALLICLPGATQPVPRELRHPGYREFFDELRQAVRTNDREHVSTLISYPLRVTTPNAAGTYRRSRFYRTPAAVRADYDRIFTSRVRQTILRQRFERLFVNSRGVMFGNGEVWFAEVCNDQRCTTASAPRIITVNP